MYGAGGRVGKKARCLWGVSKWWIQRELAPNKPTTNKAGPGTAASDKVWR